MTQFSLPGKHIYPITIIESHLDTLGHVNHAIYLMLFEKARTEMIKERGFADLLDIQETGISPIVLEVNLKFRKELLLHQKVMITTEVHSYSKRIAIISQEIKDDEDTLCCIAKFKFGLFNLKKRRLIQLTPDWFEALGISTESH